MELAELFGRLTRHREIKAIDQPTVEDAFYQMAVRLAGGEEIDVEDVSDMLDQADKTHEELETLVAELQGRAVRVKHIEEEPTAAELNEAEQTVNKLSWKILDLQREYEEKIAAAQARLASLLGAQSRAGVARSILQGTVLNPAIIRERRLLELKMKPVHARSRELQEQIAPLKKSLDYTERYLQSESGRSSSSYDRQEHAAKLERYAADLREIKSRLAPLEKELAKVDAERAELARQASELDDRCLLA